MKLTGKCKDKFEKWYRKNDNEFCIGYPNGHDDDNMCEDFYDLPHSYQFGVMVDFFDSVYISIGDRRQTKNWYVSHCFIYDFRCNTRHEARQKAIEKANELMNEKL